ncbi:hypothetical protein JCM21900_004685 [Sporobolomyces salmonicolor]
MQLDASSLAGYAVASGALVEGGNVHLDQHVPQGAGEWADGRAEAAAPLGRVAWSAANLHGIGDAQTDRRDQAGRAPLPSSLVQVAGAAPPSAFLPPSRPGLQRASSSPSPYLSVPPVSATSLTDPARPLPQAWSTAFRLPHLTARSSFSAHPQHPTSVPLEPPPARAPTNEPYYHLSDASRTAPPVTSQPPTIPPSSRWQRHSFSGSAPAAALPTWPEPTLSLAPADSLQPQVAFPSMWNSTLRRTADWGTASAQSQAANSWLGRPQAGVNGLFPTTSSSYSTPAHAPALAVGRRAVVVPSVPSSLPSSTMPVSPYDYSLSPLSADSNSPSSMPSFRSHSHPKSFDRRRASLAYSPTVPPSTETQSSLSDTLPLTSSSSHLYSINPSSTIVHPVASTSTAELVPLPSLDLPSRHVPFSSAPRPPISVNSAKGKGKAASLLRSNPSSTSASATSLGPPSVTAPAPTSRSPSISTSPPSASAWIDGDADLSDPDDYYPLPSVPLPPGAKPKKPRKKRRKLGEPPRDLAQRKYACELCVEEPKSFARPSALKIHMLTHTKEKPHVCAACSRGFAIIGNLKRHQKLHEKEEESGVPLVASGQPYEGGAMAGGGGQGTNLTWVPLAGARRRGGDAEQYAEDEEERGVDGGRLEQ